MSSAPIDRPAPPPGLVPPTYPSPSTQLEPPLPAAPPPPPIPYGYTQSRGITISPTVLAWIPAVCLTVIFFLTFFPWVGSYVGSTAVYSQNAWQEMAGSQSSDQALVSLMKKQPGGLDRVLDKVKGSVAVMLPYFLALIFAIIIAWAERMVATLDRNRLPTQFRWVASVWPYRIPIVAGLSTIVLLLLVIQMSRGFGLERAFRQAVSEKFAELREKNANSPQAQEEIDYNEQQELARYNLERTTWLYLALLLNILVVLAMIVRAWLDRRGNKPAPRIVFQY
jgi:hypothetical protein